MKVVVACDSFKGSLSSLEAGEAIKRGVLKAIPDAEVCVRPLADGGEGTVEALTLGMGGKIESVEVTGPLGEKVNCRYGILEESKTAIMEMAGAAGITLVPDEKRNPLHTTTYGVGEVIKDAISSNTIAHIFHLFNARPPKTLFLFSNMASKVTAIIRERICLGVGSFGFS